MGLGVSGQRRLTSMPLQVDILTTRWNQSEQRCWHNLLR